MSFKKLVSVNKGQYGQIYICEYDNMLKIVKCVDFELTDCALLKSVIRETFLLKNINHTNCMNTDTIFITSTKD